MKVLIKKLKKDNKNIHKIKAGNKRKRKPTTHADGSKFSATGKVSWLVGQQQIIKYSNFFEKIETSKERTCDTNKTK